MYLYVDRIGMQEKNDTPNLIIAEDLETRSNTMGHIASVAQILSNVGGIYEIVR